MEPVSFRPAFLIGALLACGATVPAENWTQWKFDCRHSGNASDRDVTTPLGLLAAVPLSDAVFTAPVVADGRVYVVDGSGVAWCLDAGTLEVVWKFETEGGPANCNNVSSPAVADDYLHFGTMTGSHYVLDRDNGQLVEKIETGDPIFSAPVVGSGSVYIATLGSRVYALEPEGTIRWKWDFVRDQLKFNGDRWSGDQWHRERGQVNWRDQFCCTRNIALHGKTLIVPAGGTLCWLEDVGNEAALRGTYRGRREAPTTLGLSIGESGEVYRQWHQRDNNGSVEILQLRDGEVAVDQVPGTQTTYQGSGSPSLGHGSLSFSSVSLRGRDVYRCRPEHRFGLCLHAADGTTSPLWRAASIAPPILLKNSVVYGGLDGRLHVVSLSDERKVWSFRTAFSKAVTAPVAVCDGRIYFGCDDGYLYALGPHGSARLPTRDLGLHRIRTPLSGKFTDSRYDWYTAFGNQANTNAAVNQGLKPPLELNWVRRFEGTCKHFSVCGGGRLYTHTAEGQIFAVEQETGRLLWRRYFPGVYVSFTAPIYHDERIYVPQAGIEKCRLRCLDAATGRLIWEAPFTGSPSWNRQLPPVLHKNLVIYPFSSGKYTPKTWLFEHQSTFGFPADQKPLVRAYDIHSGKEVWTRDFSEYGSGGDDAGICLLDGVLYYSCYFGGEGPLGVTMAMEPETGRVLWSTTKYALHAGCTISGQDGRLYLGGYNPVEGKKNYVWCLNAKDGSLVWKSDPVSRAIHVITIGKRFLFTHSQYQNGYLLEKDRGKIISTLTKGYRCTRFTFCEPYLLGPNLEMFDLSDPSQPRVVSSGPTVDLLICIGAIVSNGRVFHTTNGTGLQCSAVCGEEAVTLSSPWQSRR
jgi:outer membrane protein assembly factor BamB